MKRGLLPACHSKPGAVVERAKCLEKRNAGEASSAVRRAQPSIQSQKRGDIGKSGELNGKIKPYAPTEKEKKNETHAYSQHQGKKDIK